jgi:hypothetical protein
MRKTCLVIGAVNKKSEVGWRPQKVRCNVKEYFENHRPNRRDLDRAAASKLRSARDDQIPADSRCISQLEATEVLPFHR